MKVFAQGFMFHPKGITTTWEPINYVLSQPISTFIVGCDSIAQLEENVLIAKAFKKLSPEQLKEIEKKTEKYPRRACFFRSKYGGYNSREKLDEPYNI
jgi:predicted aldo/keto reductase-like oxidoreductase